MKQFTTSEYGDHTRVYYNAAGLVSLPDMDVNLYWEFYDSGGTLRFTATISSSPAIVAGVDSVSVSNIPLTAFALGIVEVRAYGRVGGASVIPSPEIDYPFEIIADDSMVAQLRDLLRLDDTSQDTLLSLLIDSSAAYAEKYLGRSLLTQTRTKQIVAPLNRGISESIYKTPVIALTYPPVQSISRVYTVTDEGDETDIDSGSYWLDDVSDPPELHLKSISWSDKLRVDYTAGYGSTYPDLPDAIRRGILLHAAYMFKYRGDCPDGEAAEKSGAISAYRIYRVMRRG